MTENNELNLNELEQASGGVEANQEKAGGSPTKLPPLAGYKNYQIQSGDTMTRIAYNHNTTVNALMDVNKKWIKNKNLIRAGYYMYVPKN